MIMKPPSFNGKGSVMTFLAKFDNFGEYNGWFEKEKFHYLTNALEDPVAQILWDLQSPGIVIQVQAQRRTNLDSALQVAQHMEAVMRTVISMSSKPVRTVIQGAGDPREELN